MFVSLRCPSQAEIQKLLWQKQGEGSADAWSGRTVHQLDAIRLEEEVGWLSVIDKEDDPHAFLDEEDDQ